MTTPRRPRALMAPPPPYAPPASPIRMPVPPPLLPQPTPITFPHPFHPTPPTLPTRKRKPKFFFRPIDSPKHRGWRGRLHDALTGTGPDISVGTERPRRGEWSKWDGDLWESHIPAAQRNQTKKNVEGWVVDNEMVWARRTDRGRGKDERYNFATRRYEGERERDERERVGRLWSDARYHPDTGAVRGWRVQPGVWYHV